MKRLESYETPEIRDVSVEYCFVLCTSVVSFGEEGGAGIELYEDEDIWDGGSF